MRGGARRLRPEPGHSDICDKRSRHGNRARQPRRAAVSRSGRPVQPGDGRRGRRRCDGFVRNSPIFERIDLMGLMEETLVKIHPQHAGCAGQGQGAPRPVDHAALGPGRLMDLAMDLAGITGSVKPPVARKTIVTMAGDHGVAAEGVSAYPQEVTPQMVMGFVAGMAGISVLGRLAGAKVVVADLGVAADLSARWPRRARSSTRRSRWARPIWPAARP